MSTVANQETTKPSSRLASIVVGLMAVGAVGVLIQSAAGTHEWHRWEFLGLAVAAFSLAQLTAVREEGTSRVRTGNAQPSLARS